MGNYDVTIRTRDGREKILPAIQIEKSYLTDPETHEPTGVVIQLLHRRRTEEQEAEATMINMPDDGTTDVYIVNATTGKTVQSAHWPPRQKEMRAL